MSEAKTCLEDKRISTNTLPYYQHDSCPTCDFFPHLDVGFHNLKLMYPSSLQL